MFVWLSFARNGILFQKSIIMQPSAGAGYFPCSWSRSLAEQSEWYLAFPKEKSTHVQLPVPYDRRCSGSSHGWLATADENFAIAYKSLNPFTKLLPIILPHLEFIPSHYERHSIECKKQYEYYVPKVILSADPCLNPENYVVVAIYDFCYRLASIKAGQKSWTYIKDTVGFFDDVFYNNQIYAVKNGGEIVSLDVNSSNDPSRPPKVNEVTAPLPLYKHHFSCRADMTYLVESTSGDLLHVRRFFTQKEGLWIDSFTVYKLVFNGMMDPL